MPTLSVSSLKLTMGILAGVLLALAPTGAFSQTFTFSYSGVIENWTVPQTGTYRVTAVGAQGSSAQAGRQGGRGAQISGEFDFVSGQLLQIAVGGAGTTVSGNGGGGGGTFLVDDLDQPLVIAGGGGGTREAALQDGTDASIVEAAYTGSGSSGIYAPAVKSTGIGQGGAVSSTTYGSGGGGFNSDGQTDICPTSAGGRSWSNGLAPAGPSGGFGGGGSGEGCFGGGGGGGYSGGDGGLVAGGGGSFNAGSNSIAIAGVGYDNGRLTIELVDGTSDPVDVVDVTTGLIGQFMESRSQLILAHQPDIGRRLARLSGVNTPNTISALGFSASGGGIPFSLSVSPSQMTFAYSAANASAGDGISTMAGPVRANNSDQQASNAGAPLAIIAANEVAGVAHPEIVHVSDPVDFWIEAAVSKFNANGDGHFAIVHTGLDYLATPDVLIGLGAQLDLAEMDRAGGSSVSGRGYMVGPYITARVIDDLYFDARIAAGQSFNTVSPFGTYSDDFNATRWMATAAIIGDLELADWTVRPEVRLSWFGERSESYTDDLGNTIPSVLVETGTLRFGPTIERSFALENNAVLTPIVKAEGIWTFAQENTATAVSSAPGLEDTGLRARLEGGFDLQLESGLTFNGSVFYDGIGSSDYEAYGASIGLKFSF